MSASEKKLSSAGRHQRNRPPPRRPHWRLPARQFPGTVRPRANSPPPAGRLRDARFEAGLFSACLPECLKSDRSARFPLHEDITYSIEVTPAENRTTCWPMASSVWPAKTNPSAQGRTNLSHGAAAGFRLPTIIWYPAVPRPGGASDLVASEGPCLCTPKIANRRATAVTFSKHSFLPRRFEKRRCRTCVCL